MRRLVLVLVRVSVLLPLLLLLSFGCGKSGPKLVPVSGRVMMDGKPLAHASVTFQPLAKSADGTPAVDSVGTTGDDGHYTLKAHVGESSAEGAVAGKHRVRITLFDRTAAVQSEGKTKVGVELVPAKYHSKSTLEFTVPDEGTDKADFLNLTSK